MAKKKTINFDKYKIEKIKRSQIKEAVYNPRSIDEKSLLNLKKYIRKKGLLFPAIVVNETTGNLVQGHQRLKAMDAIAKGSDYDLNVSVVKLSQKDEAEANVKLNSSNLQGDWEIDKLFELSDKFNLDMSKDLDFAPEEIDLFAAEIGLSVDSMYEEEKDIYSEYEEESKKKMKAAKEKYRDKMKEKNKNGETIYSKDDDYSVTVIFRNNTEKSNFMRDIKKPANEKYIHSDEIYKIANGTHRIRIGNGKKNRKTTKVK
jgi:hypothetical protein